MDSGETIGSVWDQVELLWRVLTVDLAKAQVIAELVVPDITPLARRHMLVPTRKTAMPEARV